MTGVWKPFELSDLTQVPVQDRHAHLVPLITLRPLAMTPMLTGLYSWTYWSGTGRPVFCGGVIGKGNWCWAFLARDMRKHMVAVTRGTRATLALHPGPVRASIDPKHPEAVRWANILGFERTQDPLVWVLPNA